MTADDVLVALRDPSVGFTNEQVRVAWDLLKARHNLIQGMLAQTFRAGDVVTFKDRAGQKLIGKVTRANTKTVTVQVGPVSWKVGSGLLCKES